MKLFKVDAYFQAVFKHLYYFKFKLCKEISQNEVNLLASHLILIVRFWYLLLDFRCLTKSHLLQYMSMYISFREKLCNLTTTESLGIWYAIRCNQSTMKTLDKPTNSDVLRSNFTWFSVSPFAETLKSMNDNFPYFCDLKVTN